MEDQADYITESKEALEMLGKGYDDPSVEIEPARTVVERRGAEFKEIERAAFVKISTSFKGELVGMSDAALKVWLFISLSVNRKTGRANPGLRTIAAALGKGVNTIRECLTELESLGLLLVDRNSKKYNIYEPTNYVSANRSDVSEPDTVEKSVSENSESVSENSESVSASQILNQRNQNKPELRKPDLLDGILKYHLHPKAIQDSIRDYFKLTPNWEAKYNRQFMEWSMEQGISPEQIKQAAELWRIDKRFNWTVPTLKGIQEHWLELTATEIYTGVKPHAL